MARYRLVTPPLRTVCLLPALVVAILNGCIFTNSAGTLEQLDSSPDTSDPPQDTSPTDTARPDASDADNAGDAADDIRPPRDASDSGAYDADALHADTDPSPAPLVIYVNGEGKLSYIDTDRVTHTVADPGSEANIRAIGPSVDFDGDDVREIPFVSPGSQCTDLCLKLAELQGGEVSTPDRKVLTRASYGRLAVDDVDGNGEPDIIYPGNRGTVRRLDDQSAEYGAKVIESGDDGTDANARSILGLVEVSTDDGNELRLYWVDDSDDLKYTRPRVESNIVHYTGSELSAGSNNNVGIGSVANLKNGTAFWPLIDGSNRPTLRQVYGQNADHIELISHQVAAKAPPTMQDLAGSDRPELLFVGNSDSHTLQHVPTDPIVADSPRALDAVGGEITADPAVGLAPGTAPAPR